MGKFYRFACVLLAILLVVQPALKAICAQEEGEDFEDDFEEDAAFEGEDFGEDGFAGGEGDLDESEFPDDQNEFGNEDLGGEEGDEEVEGVEPDAIPEGDDGDVIALSNLTLPGLIKEKEYVLIEFYAPWCGHCKSLAPEYRKAAEVLKEFNVVVAKVDATKYEALASEYDVSGFPTIIWSANNKVGPYTGGRTSEEIISWVKKKVGFAVTNLKSVEEATSYLGRKGAVAIGLFDSAETEEAKVFSNAAKDVDGIEFLQTSDARIAAVFGLDSSKEPALAVIKQEEEKFIKFEGVYELDAVKEFLNGNKLPLIVTFNEENAQLIFGGEIKKQILLFAPPEDYSTILGSIAAAALEFKGKIVFVYINGTDEEADSVREFFGIASGNTTAIMGFYMPTEQESKKYKFAEDITAESVKIFAGSIVDGTAKPFYKSDPIPEKNDEDVKVVVADSFEEIVLDTTKDVLLEIYAPWCGHCKNLEPIYKKLGKKFSTVDSVVIAKMDGTGNEYPGVEVEGFPTLFFYPANKKSEPVKVEVAHKVKAFTKFIKEHASLPFTLPSKEPPPKTVEEVAEEAELKREASDVSDEL